LLVDSAKLPLEKVISGDYNKLNSEQQDHIYGRGWLIFHYLSFAPARQGQLKTYLAALQSGKNGLESAKLAFGDLKTFSGELDKYLMQKRLPVRRIAATSIEIGQIAVEPLGPGEAAFMKVRTRSTVGVDEKAAKQLVLEGRRAASPFRNDPVVQGYLAEVEHDASNWVEADAAASRALAADPENVQALIYKGRVAIARLSEGKSTDKVAWRTARNWFVKASRIDMEDPEPKVLYHSSFAAEGLPPTRNAVEALTYAMDLVPQDKSLRLQVAHQHLTDGKLAEAQTALAPVAYNPHGGTVRDWAVKVMARLKAGDSKGALAAWEERTERTKSS
jgi:hypothetical protein